MHREHQVSHRRVSPLLNDEGTDATKHGNSGAFSKVTSKSAAVSHNGISGKSSVGRFARGGKVKGGTTNIIIASSPKEPAGPMPLPMGGPPPGPPPGAPPMMPPPGAGGPPPGMPMRARGGKINGGESTKANIDAMASRAKKNSYAMGGAITGVGRLGKASRQKGK
jgi:hypothetical protein